ncbi:O-methyltransferase family 2 [Pectobacterium versatile]|uniref:hypothetical protein n=1 Tax=Pectobacterium versatile TaxID=2488639 RepID=UPI000D41DDFE|nr:hypothetical protein [Pectobacterium versatile]POY58105.1 O-methyltransferase family 2 [Pectobacterium versatile]POY63092.1 O-methyltransferase family 2 [Pectobacterium versatile]
MFLASFQHTFRIGINDVLDRKLILAMKLDNKGKYMNSAEHIRSISEIMMMPLAAKALCVAAEIGIADKIREQGATIAELAKECQASEKNISNIIKVLEIFGLTLYEHLAHSASRAEIYVLPCGIYLARLDMCWLKNMRLFLKRSAVLLILVAVAVAQG